MTTTREIDQHVSAMKAELATCDCDCRRCERLVDELSLLGSETLADFDMLAAVFRRSGADAADAAFVESPFAVRRRAELEERKVADV